MLGPTDCAALPRSSGEVSVNSGKAHGEPNRVSEHCLSSPMTDGGLSVVLRRRARGLRSTVPPNDDVDSSPHYIFAARQS